MERRQDRFPGRQQPIGFGEEGGEDVRQIKRAGYEKYFFDASITAVHDEQPHGNRSDGHGNVFADVQRF